MSVLTTARSHRRAAVVLIGGLVLASFGEAMAQDREVISPEEFMATPFSQFFKEGDDPRALQAIEALVKMYPNDPLILRYRAMVLDRLGRSAEAIASFQELLVRDPRHVPTRFFLGHAYERARNRGGAITEWRWVIEHSPSEAYRQLAQEQLDRLGVKVARPVERRRLYLTGNIGIDYDSNPLLKPNDKQIATPGNEKQAERFSSDLGLGYQLVLRPDARVDVIATTRQSLHDRGVDRVNFTAEELALDAKKRLSLWAREVMLGARYDLLSGWLDGRFFSLSNRMLLSADMRLTPQTRTYAYHRFTVADFGPDGSNPPQTSRDGFTYDLGVTQYVYTADFRRYLFVGQELNVGQPRGANFTRRGTATRIGIHTPVPFVRRTDLDLTGGFRLDTYPRFTSLSSADPTRRRDTTWDLLASLTYHWTSRLATRVLYRLINANNRNDFFQYDRHIGGIQFRFTESF